jgi:hypothetical protein
MRKPRILPAVLLGGGGIVGIFAVCSGCRDGGL